jgi:hypothetical protein
VNLIPWQQPKHSHIDRSECHTAVDVTEYILRKLVRDRSS